MKQHQQEINDNANLDFCVTAVARYITSCTYNMIFLVIRLWLYKMHHIYQVTPGYRRKSRNMGENVLLWDILMVIIDKCDFIRHYYYLNV